MRHAYLSYTGLLFGLCLGKRQGHIVSEDTMKDALFAFGCAREHLLRDIEKDLGEIEWAPGAAGSIVAHQKIVVAVLEAEKDGRVCWVKNKTTIDCSNRAYIDFFNRENKDVSNLAISKEVWVTHGNLDELVKFCGDYIPIT